MNHQLWKKSPAVAMAAVVVVGVSALPAVASAGEPLTTDFIGEASIVSHWEHRIDDAGTSAYAGIDQCDELLDEDSVFDGSFVASETHIIDFNDTNHFGGAFRYSGERGDSSFACLAGPGDEVDEDCTEISDEHYSVNEVGDEISFNVPLESFLDLDDEDCEAGELDRSYRIQIAVRDEENYADDRGYEHSELRLVVDFIRPETPVLNDAFVTENTISVEFDPSESDDVDSHAVVYSSEEFSEGDSIDDLQGPDTVTGEESGEVDGSFSPGETIYVGVVARDRAGNWSFVSAPISATVIETDGFWDFYVDRGGSEQGGYGCAAGGQTAPAAALSWLVVIVAMLGLMRVVAPGRARQTAEVCSCDNEARRR